MHDLIDTEDADAATESYWPEQYKGVIRERIRASVLDELSTGRPFEAIFKESYGGRFADYSQFSDRIASMVAIGGENGADDAFDGLHAAFLADAPLPPRRRHARFVLACGGDGAVWGEIRDAVIAEYAKEHAYHHVYEHYEGLFHGFADFINQVAERVADGAVNGADDMAAAVYRSLWMRLPLPPARRHPRRLKRW